MLQFSNQTPEIRFNLKEDIVLSERVDAANQAATPQAAAIGKVGDADASNRMLELILGSLDDNKAEEVITIPLTGKSAIADNMVVASGRSSRQVQALAEHIMDRIKTETGIICRVEGRQSGDWILVDCGDAVVHLFRPEVREFYQIEKMWQAATPDSTQA